MAKNIVSDIALQKAGSLTRERSPPTLLPDIKKTQTIPIKKTIDQELSSRMLARNEFKKQEMNYNYLK